ncbi:MAG TPA: hypothetical protein VJ865_02775 [Gemmatimonadaceae bacterium]|nr:hypothetical protein [Gemmatimonadaceae bacterium]
MNESGYRYHNQAVASFDALVAKYGSAELSSPLRSTVSLLAYWGRTNALPDFEGAVGRTISHPIDLSFEHQVPVRAGRGKASHTDLLIRSQSSVFAIEAKRAEPPYETVSIWHGAERSPNRTSVLQGWLDLINDTFECTLTISAVGDLTYQLIHRTASACEGSAQTRAVVYQCFDPTGDQTKHYLGQLRRLKEALGPQANLDLFLMQCVTRPSAEFERLKARWVRREKGDLSGEIAAGLRNGSLLDFEPSRSTRV